MVYHPFHTVWGHAVKFMEGQPKVFAAAAKSTWNTPENDICQFDKLGSHVLFREVGRQKADAAVNVVSYSPWTDNPFFIVCGGYPAYRKAVSFMTIGQGDRILVNTR